MQVITQPVAPVVPDITITLKGEEAAKLRRACYYNKTLGIKYAGNPKGNPRKGQDLDAFMGQLGSQLKAAGVPRF